MNKIILNLILIGGFFLILVSGYIIREFVLRAEFSQEKLTEKPPLSETQPSESKESPALPEDQPAAAITHTSQLIPALGIYEVCSDPADCNLKTGIEKIKAIGATALIVTVVDEEDDVDNFSSVAYYPSQYLPMAEGVPRDYLKETIELAHKEKIKVYASINIPHNHWLKKHSDWIAIWSNGERADVYEKDYFHRIVPSSRIIAEKECQGLLKNIIAEVVSYSVDGIDINDNFQFSDQYLEESDITLFSSFDDFTVRKFEDEENVTIQGNSPQKWAEYIKNQPALYEKWLRWRAGQVTQLIKILKEDIKKTGVNIPLRPHLLTWGDPYEYYGLDYQDIAKEVDVLYLMITPDKPKEEYFEIIRKARNIQANPVRNTISNGAKKIVASTYLFKEIDSPVIERNEEKLLERMSWIKEAGASEIYVYNFDFIEKGNLWLTLKNIFD